RREPYDSLWRACSRARTGKRASAGARLDRSARKARSRSRNARARLCPTNRQSAFDSRQYRPRERSRAGAFYRPGRPRRRARVASAAKATDFLGDSGKATQLVVASYERYPSAEAAHEAASLFEKAGKTDEAIRYLTEAFTIADPHSTSAD